MLRRCDCDADGGDGGEFRFLEIINGQSKAFTGRQSQQFVSHEEIHDAQADTLENDVSFIRQGTLMLTLKLTELDQLIRGDIGHDQLAGLDEATMDGVDIDPPSVTRQDGLGIDFLHMGLVRANQADEPPWLSVTVAMIQILIREMRFRGWSAAENHIRCRYLVLEFAGILGIALE